MKRSVRKIIIHCSDSEWGSASEIRKWHLANNWSDINNINDVGYHFVISNGMIKPSLYLPALDGTIETGRDIELAGAHARGDNHDSIGICLIGRHSFTRDQYISLYTLLDSLCRLFSVPYENIMGHYETDSGLSQGKTCPNFNVANIRKDMEELYEETRKKSPVCN